MDQYVSLDETDPVKNSMEEAEGSHEQAKCAAYSDCYIKLGEEPMLEKKRHIKQRNSLSIRIIASLRLEKTF